MHALFTRTFTFDEATTCKRSWTFTLHRDGGDLIVDDLQIADDRRPDGQIQGCHGHPKTIAVLLKGRNVASIDAATLAAATCPRKQSCCQVLAECLAPCSPAKRQPDPWPATAGRGGSLPRNL